MPTTYLRDLRAWLFEATRRLPRGLFPRPSAPPTPYLDESIEEPDQPNTLTTQRGTEIPPDQQPGGGPPHR